MYSFDSVFKASDQIKQYTVTGLFDIDINFVVWADNTATVLHCYNFMIFIDPYGNKILIQENHSLNSVNNLQILSNIL